ncbi:MAG: type II toxin-antitoxin system VapC family toxin [Anaerolineaceae bacterium]|nr:type II toxin-antitoxin system VapC family toxin [Anaerolineaceae bacterium]
MNYLLDTCILSEFARKRPEEKVIEWLDSIDEEMLFISVISIGEIQRGIEKMEESNRRGKLSAWLNMDVRKRFGNRLIKIDENTMLRWGTLTASLEKNGHPMSVMDSLIAASAFQENLILVTRNIKDFEYSRVPLINPWDDEVN